MSTKLNPGPYDCYAEALPDEPMFVLLARDKLAPELVRDWAALCGDQAKSREALNIANAMEKWRRERAQ